MFMILLMQHLLFCSFIVPDSHLFNFIDKSKRNHKLNYIDETIN